MRSPSGTVLASRATRVVRRFPRTTIPGVEKKSLLPDVDPRAPPSAGAAGTKEVGWTKGVELAKLARRDGQDFDCATWLHKAREMPKEQFKHEVEKELTGIDSEPAEIIYFKFYKSQIPVIEQAIETAGLMLGTDKSRGYCLEMICADFLAGANLDYWQLERPVVFGPTFVQFPVGGRTKGVS